MNEDQRHTAQLVVGGLLALGFLSVVSYLAVTATDTAERGQLIIALSTGLGAASSFFLGNMTTARRSGTGSGGPTVNVDTDTATVTPAAGANPAVTVTASSAGAPTPPATPPDFAPGTGLHG